MSQQKFCQGCNQKHRCDEVYGKLGKSDFPSITREVAVAFLIPIIVFVACLASFERILAGFLHSEQWRILVSFLVGLLVAIGVILLVRVIDKRLLQE
jgi:hypothetical protein